MEKHTVYILNGPNLNFFGMRDNAIYGSVTLKALLDEVKETFSEHINIETFQTNHVGNMIDKIQELALEPKKPAIIINPGAWTHYDYSLADSLADFSHIARMPIIELHLSNVHKREKFRHHSVVSPIADAIIVGFGEKAYYQAVLGIIILLNGTQYTLSRKPFNN